MHHRSSLKKERRSCNAVTLKIASATLRLSYQSCHNGEVRTTALKEFDSPSYVQGMLSHTLHSCEAGCLTIREGALPHGGAWQR